jgi:hypothetical protein
MHGKIYNKKVVKKDNKKMVQFLTQVEESRLKIIENKIIER